MVGYVMGSVRSPLRLLCVFTVLGLLALSSAYFVRVEKRGPSILAMTQSNLEFTAVFVRLLSKEERGGIECMKDIIEMAKSDKSLRSAMPESGEIEAYFKDAYGRDFHFAKMIFDDFLVIRLMHAGDNGILEGGGGDDVYVELIFEGERHIGTYERQPTQDGQGKISRLQR